MRCGMHGVLERRDKWDVDERFVLPMLDDILDDIAASGEVHHMTVDVTGFTYGMLYAREQQLAHQRRQEAREPL